MSYPRYIPLLLACCLIQACTTMASLSKPHHKAHFVLRKEYLRLEHRGVFDTEWVFGLRAGTHRLVAEDRKGLYFLGQGGCAIDLMGPLAKAFLRSGRLPETEQRGGGIWLPKPGVHAAPKLFVIQHFDNDEAQLGLTMMVIADLPENGLVHYRLGSEKAILGNARVVSN